MMVFGYLITVKNTMLKQNLKNDKYSNEFLKNFITNAREHLYVNGIISCPYIEENTLKDILLLVPKKDVRVAN